MPSILPIKAGVLLIALALSASQALAEPPGSTEGTLDAQGATCGFTSDTQGNHSRQRLLDRR